MRTGKYKAPIWATRTASNEPHSYHRSPGPAQLLRRKPYFAWHRLFRATGRSGRPDGTKWHGKNDVDSHASRSRRAAPRRSQNQRPRHDGGAAAPDRARGHRLCSRGKRHLCQSLGAGESDHGGACWQGRQARLELRARAGDFPAAARAAVARRTAALRRRAADADHRPRAHD